MADPADARIQFRRGDEADRTSYTPASGEPVWTEDEKKLYIGDGTTAGGVAVGGGGGGSAWGDITGTLADQTDLQDALDDKTSAVSAGAYTTTTIAGIQCNVSNSNSTIGIGNGSALNSGARCISIGNSADGYPSPQVDKVSIGDTSGYRGGQNSIAIGTNANYYGGAWNVSLGTNAGNHGGMQSVTIGYQAGYVPNSNAANASTSSDVSQTLIGFQCGKGSSATSPGIVCVGASSTAIGDSSVAVGTFASAAHANSIALGKATTTNRDDSACIGARDLEITDSAKGVILKSPDGNLWRVTVDNTGTLTTAAV